MNYLDLSTRLANLAEKLSKQATKIEGNDAAKSAMKLVTELDRFETVLDSYLASRKSGEFFLETLLRSPSATLAMIHLIYYRLIIPLSERSIKSIILCTSGIFNSVSALISAMPSATFIPL